MIILNPPAAPGVLLPSHSKGTASPCRFAGIRQDQGISTPDMPGPARSDASCLYYVGNYFSFCGKVNKTSAAGGHGAGQRTACGHKLNHE